MKKIILTLILALSFTVSNATEKEIIAKVIFKNQTEKKLVSGKFYITETNKKIEIKNTDSFKITLPKKGRYHFNFVTNDFIAFTFYPARITKRNNTITICLVKNKLIVNKKFTFPIISKTKHSKKQTENSINNENLNFIIHGINNSLPKELIKFKKKYGVGFIIKNCDIDPLSYKEAVKNNQMVYQFLNKKYGKTWLSELQIKPFGIK